MYEKIYSEILSFFPLSMNEICTLDHQLWNSAEEIRVRVGQPICLKMNQGEILLHQKVDSEGIVRLLENFSNNSIYSVQSEINAGFLTIRGGHRIGISGTTIIENGSVKNIKYISSLNIRIAREIKGCSNSFMPHLFHNGEFMNTLIVSPPGCGKTTILRDIIRQLSNGTEMMKGQNVGLVDERSEIAAMYRGIPQNDVGARTDVMNNCVKHIGMNMLIRSMGSQIIATDEIGSEEDRDAIHCAVNSGIKLLLTAHGSEMEDVIVRDEKIFQNVIILMRRDRPGIIKKVYTLKEGEYVACS